VASDYGANLQGRTTEWCNADTLPVSPTAVTALRWNLAPLDTNVRMTDAAMDFLFTKANRNTWNAVKPEVWMSATDWTACNLHVGQSPLYNPAGAIATSVPLDSVRVRFRSDALAALMEAQVRHRLPPYGILLRSLLQTVFISPATFDPATAPRLVIHYRRVSPEPAS